MQPTKKPMRGGIPVHLDQDLVFLLGQMLNLMKADYSENSHALIEQAVFYFRVSHLYKYRQVLPTHNVYRKVSSCDDFIHLIVCSVDIVPMNLIVKIPFEVANISGNKGLMMAMRYHHTGM